MGTDNGTEVSRAFAIGLRVWLVATALVLAGTFLIYVLAGIEGLQAIVQKGPNSALGITLASVAVVWLAVGACLALLSSPAVRAEHGPLIVGTLLVVILYANVLRECPSPLDARDYANAAVALAADQPFGPRYLYPPLLATVLAPVARWGGESATIGAVWLSNIVALAAFVPLVVACLRRYGLGRHGALLLSVLFAVANVPLLRTLVYGQANLHVANCILLSLLMDKRLRVVSAVALALAVHLKMSPILLALPYVWERDWKWLAWFAAGLAGLAALTLLPHGIAPFLSVAGNLRHIYQANGICFRENSVDSLLRSLALISGTSPDRVSGAAMAVKLCLLVAVLGTAWSSCRARLFGGEKDWGVAVPNATPVLLLGMLLVSPLLWEHHPVLVALPFLLLLVRLQGAKEYVLYGGAYVLVYWLPTFDCFPWSFGRLVGLVTVLWLLYRASQDGRPWSPARLAVCPPLQTLDQWLEQTWPR
jgi:alpha-1,2-mannosyltransferase